MEGLSMTWLNSKTSTFDYDTYAKYCKINPPEAKRYIESFNTPQKEVVIEKTVKNEDLETQKTDWVDTIQGKQSEWSSNENQSNLELQTSSNNNEIGLKVSFSDENINELRKVYQETVWKKAYHWLNGVELVEAINNAKK